MQKYNIYLSVSESYIPQTLALLTLNEAFDSKVRLFINELLFGASPVNINWFQYEGIDESNLLTNGNTITSWQVESGIFWCDRNKY